MERKLYPCQIPGCSNKAAIRSRIKSGLYKGKKACGYCKQKYDGKSIKPITEKRKKKRKEERKGLPEFFSYAIEKLKLSPVCQNCGGKIRWWSHPVNNIAHILAKRNHKSVMDNKNNFVILCASKDEGECCHEKFDNRINDRPNMPVFEITKKKYLSFKDQVLEKSNEKRIFDEN
jgi:hypothetical protein